MIYLEGPGVDPRQNLAVEQYIFDRMDPRASYLMLWQNDNAVIVGKHQNTFEEVNPEAVRREGTAVVRRLSGGGAVYHDLGNLNYTFITDHEGGNALSFARFCRPVIDTLRRLGLDAQIDGRNDMTVDGRKFSGNAQYIRHGRVMHHGTLLIASDLDRMQRLLSTASGEIRSKAYRSVHSRVINLAEALGRPLPLETLKAALLDTLRAALPLTRYNLTPADLLAIEEIRRARYDRWEWNYGVSPDAQLRKSRRIEGCGRLDIHLDLHRGRIARIAFYGDYFAIEADDHPLRRALTGCPLDRAALMEALAPFDLARYFGGIDREAFLEALCG